MCIDIDIYAPVECGIWYPTSGLYDIPGCPLSIFQKKKNLLPYLGLCIIPCSKRRQYWKYMCGYKGSYIKHIIY